MKTLVTVASIAAFLAIPITASADPKDRQGMEGPPNAAGFKDKKGAGSQDAAGDKDNPAGGEKMKGPPNANGYKQ